MIRSADSRVIFVTGTDTGVGKTIVTALLLAHLRHTGCHAWAMKPFCSGGRGDVSLLRRILRNELSADEMNPYFFPEPIAPLVALRKSKRLVRLNDVSQAVKRLARRCDCLLIEGAGGLLAPLGDEFCALDLIQRLRCHTVVVARNRLGTLNHTLLTLRALCPSLRGGSAAGVRTQSVKTVLVDTRRPEASAASNPAVLAELISPIPLVRLPFLNDDLTKSSTLEKQALRLQPELVAVLNRPKSGR